MHKNGFSEPVFLSGLGDTRGGAGKAGERKIKNEGGVIPLFHESAQAGTFPELRSRQAVTKEMAFG